MRSGAATAKPVAIMAWHDWRRVMVTSTLVWIFRQQSLRACPTNQEVLCLHNLLLVLSGRQDNARVQREKLLRDYPLNATLWWLNWFDGRSE